MSNINEIKSKIYDINAQIRIYKSQILDANEKIQECKKQIDNLQAEKVNLLEELSSAQKGSLLSENEYPIELDFSDNNKDVDEPDFKLDIDEQNDVASAES